jgi:hypothetical protein
MSPRNGATQRFPKNRDASRHFITRHVSPTHHDPTRFPKIRTATRHFATRHVGPTHPDPTLPKDSRRVPTLHHTTCRPDTPRPGARRFLTIRTATRNISPTHITTQRFPKICTATRHFATRHVAPTRPDPTLSKDSRRVPTLHHATCRPNTWQPGA